MVQESQRYQLRKPHPAEHPTPSLLQRLSSQEETRTPKVPLLERLSNGLRHWSSHSEQGESRSHKLFSRSVKSLPRTQEEMTNSKQMHSTDTPLHLTELKPSLMSQMSVDLVSPSHPLTKERRSLVKEISDLKNLTGIMPCPTSLTSTTSFRITQGK